MLREIKKMQKELDIYNRLISFVVKRVSDVEISQDIVQEVFLKFHQEKENIHAEKTISWLYTVTRNKITDYYRIKNKNLYSGVPIESLKMKEKEDFSDFSLCLAPLISLLNFQEQNLINQVDIKGLSQKELAQKENIPYATLKSQVQRTRQKLKKLFEEHCLMINDSKSCDEGTMKQCC